MGNRSKAMRRGCAVLRRAGQVHADRAQFVGQRVRFYLRGNWKLSNLVLGANQLMRKGFYLLVLFSARGNPRP